MADNPKDADVGYPAAQNAASSCSGGCVLWWFVCGLTCLCSVVFVYLMIVLKVHPAPPEVHIASASASVASFDTSSFPFPPPLSADFNVTLSLRNPSSMFSLHYHGVRAAMMYGPTVLAEAALPDFRQGKRNSTTLQVALAAAPEYLEPSVAFGIRRDAIDGAAVVFRFDVGARVTFTPLVLNCFSVTWWVSCNEIAIWFADGTGTAGSTMGPPKGCELRRWKA